MLAPVPTPEPDLSDMPQMADQTGPDTADDNETREYIAQASRYDGSRTPADKTMMAWLLADRGRSETAIARILEMNPLTVRAVLARRDKSVADSRMLLKANALGFAGDVITASQEAAKRGKVEGILQVLDRLGVTEPPKSQQTQQLAVQVVLNGGAMPTELSPQQVTVESERVTEQAQ